MTIPAVMVACCLFASNQFWAHVLGCALIIGGLWFDRK
jgi:hypothetical protein